MSAEEQNYRDALKAADREDFATALSLLRRAAESGHAEAQYRLGVMFANAEGMALDYAEAAAWLRRAADQGLGRAQSILAWLYASGYGVQQDDREAGRLYLKAAEQGLPKDQYTVAAMYRWGRYGVDRDATEMVKWYERAANQGFAPAQFALGQMLAKGVEVPVDRITAFQWLSLAIVNGSDPAKQALMELTHEMGTGDIEFAKSQMLSTANDDGEASAPKADVGHML